MWYQNQPFIQVFWLFALCLGVGGRKESSNAREDKGNSCIFPSLYASWEEKEWDREDNL